MSGNLQAQGDPYGCISYKDQIRDLILNSYIGDDTKNRNYWFYNQLEILNGMNVVIDSNSGDVSINLKIKI